MELKVLLAEHIPLKQGLRPIGARQTIVLPIKLAEHIPLKQGLRLGKSQIYVDFGKLAEHIPLKQGLRLQKILARVIALCVLAEHIPLKQGLRLNQIVFDVAFIISQSIFH